LAADSETSFSAGSSSVTGPIGSAASRMLIVNTLVEKLASLLSARTVTS